MQSQLSPLALLPPDSPYSMRPVCRDDVDGLRRVCWAGKSVSYCADRTRRVMQSYVRRQGLGVIVLDETRQRIIAYGQIMRLAKRVEISDLIVAQAYRGQGVGTAMIQYLIQEMRRLQTLCCVEIGVLVSNTRALALYRRLGFVDSYQLSLRINKAHELVQYLRLTIPAKR